MERDESEGQMESEGGRWRETRVRGRWRDKRVRGQMERQESEGADGETRE